MDEDFEIVDEKNVNNNNSSKDIKNEVIGLDRLFDNEEEVVDVYEENLKKEELKQKKITRIQIGLIIFLVIFASLVYFFGYSFFEPFIKID